MGGFVLSKGLILVFGNLFGVVFWPSWSFGGDFLALFGRVLGFWRGVGFWKCLGPFLSFISGWVEAFSLS